MKLIDVKARNDKEIQKILNKTKKHLKDQHIHFGLIDTGIYDGVYYISVESNSSGHKYGLGSDIETFVNQSAHAKVVKIEEHEGHFDWDADIYIKPCSIVNFKLI